MFSANVIFFWLNVVFVCRAENEAEKLDALVICAGVYDEVLYATRGVGDVAENVVKTTSVIVASVRDVHSKSSALVEALWGGECGERHIFFVQCTLMIAF